MTFILKRFLPVLLMCAVAWSCSDEPEPVAPTPDETEQPEEPVDPSDPEPPEEPQPPSEPEIKNPRTVLLYIVADNSLGRGDYDADDLEEIHRAVADGALGDGAGRLLVYHNRPGTADGIAPSLYEITGGEASTDVTLKTYSDDASVYSTDAARMREVFEDVRIYAPALDYGVIFWSHATGWRSEEDAARSPIMRSFGDDRRHRMKITTLAQVMEGYDHSFIYFDCCLMGTVEVVYELRRCADVIAASGAEVHAEGMPYDLTLPHFFNRGAADIEGVARATFEYYDGRTGSDRWSTQTVVRTAALDNLATATAGLMASGPEPPASLTGIQTYSPNSAYRIYDMADYLAHCEGIAPEALAQWRSALDAAIVYRAATPKVNGSHKINLYCGLGCNIVTGADDVMTLGYNELAWWRDVVSRNPFYNH